MVIRRIILIIECLNGRIREFLKGRKGNPTNTNLPKKYSNMKREAVTEETSNMVRAMKKQRIGLRKKVKEKEIQWLRKKVKERLRKVKEEEIQ